MLHMLHGYITRHGRFPGAPWGWLPTNRCHPGHAGVVAALADSGRGSALTAALLAHGFKSTTGRGSGAGGLLRMAYES